MKYYSTLILLLLITACGTSNENIVVFSNKDSRYNNDNIFNKEKSFIEERRKSLNIQQNSPLIGLGLAGGGIRANAFNLGILSGLHSKGLLKRVDYISSVSGGSWANTSYITSTLPDKDMFRCLHDFSLSGKDDNCDIIVKKLRTKQQNWFFGKYWKKDIIDSSMSELTSIRLDNLYQILPNARTRPFPIFNATHSLPSGDEIKHQRDHFIFEFTPVGFGTDMDCATPDVPKCSNIPLLGPGQVKGFYSKSYDTYKAKKWYPFSRRDISLPDILRASSAFLNATLGIKIYNNQKNKTPEVRNSYGLSDGGKSDNTGLYSLIVRKVPIIIVTDTGRYNYRNNNIYRDFAISIDRIRSNFGITLDVEKLVYQNEPVVNLEYKDKDGKKLGNIIYVKPMITKAFFDKIKGNNKLRDFLINQRNYFPNDPTLDTEYEEERIRLYFLLGESIGASLSQNNILMR